jgi:tripartite-type tricarboxylate transporter receptor subunit TctC
MIQPNTAGGGTDVLGRIIAARLAEVLGRPVVIENLGAAGGMVGSFNRRKDGRQRGSARSQMQEFTAGKFHRSPPKFLSGSDSRIGIYGILPLNPY